jgi:hypothetical protein
MNFIRRHCYDLGLGLALIALTWQAFACIEGLQLILWMPNRWSRASSLATRCEQSDMLLAGAGGV